MNPTDKTDQQLSEPETFRLLVEEHQAAIRAFAASRIGDPFEAYDIAQEVFIVAFRKVNEIDQSRPIRPWLYQIAANLIRNHRRKRRATAVSSLTEQINELLNSQIESSQTGTREASMLDALDGCLSLLNDKARELVRLRYEEGLGIAEIRNVHGGGHSAMTMRLYRLREQLRNCIVSRLGVEHG